jgi:hypothetical protein
MMDFIICIINKKQINMGNLSKYQINGLIRHGLTAIGGALVILGYLEESVISEIIGGIMTAVGFVWSYLEKK